MRELALEYEAGLRIGGFLTVLALMALLEFASPRRRHEIPRLVRWTNNLLLVAIDSLLLRLVFPVAAIGFAIWCQTRGWGLFNYLELPLWVTVTLSVIAFDLVIYLQHVMFHAIPALWRLHRVHHADIEFDVTTALRFHPVEIMLSMVVKIVAVAALGPPALAVLAFEMLLNATAMFNHSNLRVPPRLDAVLRLLVVTPDMHRVHHSVHAPETDSNFGFNLPWWDMLLGTYRPQPRDGHERMTVGLGQFRGSRELWIDRLLTQPFRSDAGSYPTDPGKSERE